MSRRAEPSLAELGARIDAVAQMYGSRTSAARAAGVSPDQLTRYIKGENAPTFPVLAALAAGVGASLDWLATGLGSSVRREQSPSAAASAELPEYVLLPRHEVSAAAGVGAVIHSEQIVDFLAFSRDWLRAHIRADPKDLVLITAVGDSMAPTIKDGDLLLLDMRATEVRDNAIYVIGVADALMVKRVQLLSTGSLRLLSDNPAYPPEAIESAHQKIELRLIGRVVWHGGAM